MIENFTAGHEAQRISVRGCAVLRWDSFRSTFHSKLAWERWYRPCLPCPARQTHCRPTPAHERVNCGAATFTHERVNCTHERVNCIVAPRQQDASKAYQLILSAYQDASHCRPTPARCRPRRRLKNCEGSPQLSGEDLAFWPVGIPTGSLGLYMLSGVLFLPCVIWADI